MMEDDMMDDEHYEGGTVKKFLYVNRRPPHGTIYAWEALEVVLIAAAFEQDVSLLFMDDGVFQLKKDQDTKALGVKNFSPAYRALEMYDVEKLYVAGASLVERGLSTEDLLVPVEVLEPEQIMQLMEEQDVILNF